VYAFSVDHLRNLSVDHLRTLRLFKIPELFY
jgi:hypothetical protein